MHIREYKHTTMAKAISMLAFTFKTLTIIYSHTNTKTVHHNNITASYGSFANTV